MEEEQINQSEQDIITTNTITITADPDEEPRSNTADDGIAATAGAAASSKKRKKGGRPSIINIELYNRTLQNLQNVGIIQNFTSTEAVCSLCKSTVIMREAHYLYYWQRHEKSGKHQKQLYIRHHHPELFIEQQQQQQQQQGMGNSNNENKKRKTSTDGYFPESTKKQPASTRDSMNPENNYGLLSTSEPCGGILTYYDNLERDLSLCTLYYLDRKGYVVRVDDITGKKQIYTSNCPNGLVMYRHMKEINRCNSCQEIRNQKQRYRDLRIRIQKRGELFTRIDTIIDKQDITNEDDIVAIRSFQAHNDQHLSDYGKMRKQQCSQLYKYYKSTTTTTNNNKKKTRSYNKKKKPITSFVVDND